MPSLRDKVELALQASIRMLYLTSEQKNKAILALSKILKNDTDKLLEENKKDLEYAKRKKIDNINFKLDKLKINTMIAGLQQLAAFDEPVNQTLKVIELDKDLELYCVSAPIGVIASVSEGHPEAIIEIAALCLKSGNCLMFRYEQETINTFTILSDILKRVSEENALPNGWINFIDKDFKKILSIQELGLIIVVGTSKFVDELKNNSKIPVLGCSEGICHIYVDKDADIDMAVNICYDAKCQNPFAANALETMLVHKDIASEFLPNLKDVLDEAKLRLLGDDKTLKIVGIEHATEKDYAVDHNSLILSIKIVENIDEAIEHITKYGGKHTEGIITRNQETAKKFMKLIDSANVFWNCSTRFSDGYKYGMGCFAGVSTNKIHARGPVGLEGFLTYKWILAGKGQIVADYEGEELKKKFTHKRIEREFFP